MYIVDNAYQKPLFLQERIRSLICNESSPSHKIEKEKIKLNHSNALRRQCVCNKCSFARYEHEKKIYDTLHLFGGMWERYWEHYFV